MTSEEIQQQQIIQQGKFYAALSYLTVLCILPLFFKKDNSFALQHGKQGLVIFVGEVAVFVVQVVLGIWMLKLGVVFWTFISLVGVIAAVKGEHVRFPVISRIADKIML
jgi:fumarate reductase subunit D